MGQESFEKTIEKEVQKLNQRELKSFAWRCAVRALPFLGSAGHFDFWKKTERQKHLYSIFFALDVGFSSAPTSYAYTDAYTAADAAAYVASSDAASYASYAASSSAAAASKNAPASYACTAAYYASYAASAYNVRSIDLKTIILQDLKSIRKKEGPHISKSLYGGVWGSFISALESEGCAYWGNLYGSIFDNGFFLDQEAFERRFFVPQAIRGQGAAAVGDFLQEIEEKGAAPLNEARIIILGDKGVGKTCIARRLIDPDAPMTTDKESTAGVDTTPWRLEDENINVHIWDFAGHTVTHAVHQFFLSERCLYIIVYDGRTEERNRLEYWLDHMKNHGGDSKAVILVNERDPHPVDIPINTLKEKYSIEADYSFSIRDDKEKLALFRENVAAYINNNPSWNQQAIPRNYFKVKEELEGLFTKCKGKKGEEHITKKEFEKISLKHDVDDIEQLLNDLHALGISLWYKDMDQFDTLILNPEWISHGVYQIVNWLNEQEKYALTLDDFASVFKSDPSRYPTDQHAFLFNLMKHYELAYETDGDQSLIVPHLLNEDRPEELPVFHVGDSLMFRYKSEQNLPSNSISRFIVRHNQEIKKENTEYLVWRYGVVLEDEKGSTALIREEDRIISVSVKGPDKTNYIARLRSTLSSIFNSYKSEKPELQYRVERFGKLPEEVEEKNPLWLNDRKIFNHVNNNVPYYEDTTGQFIDFKPTVSIFKIKSENLMLGGQGHTLISDRSTHFNFHHCNIGLQSDLNELSQLLSEGDHEEEADELKKVANVLEQVEQCEKKEDVRKKGIGRRLERLVKDLGDEESRLHKTVKGVKHGIGIAQDIAKGYNDIAQWAGLPQVPEPFLKKDE